MVYSDNKGTQSKQDGYCYSTVKDADELKAALADGFRLTVEKVEAKKPVKRKANK
jgi:hypothetical protein